MPDDKPLCMLALGSQRLTRVLYMACLAAAPCFPILIAATSSWHTLKLFAVGTALGVSWEAPLFAPGGFRKPRLFLALLRPDRLALVLVWSSWDAIVCLVGYAMVVALGLQGRSTMGLALAVHLVWGQVSSILVETIAAITGLWAYSPSARNPSFATLWNGKHLTLLPQLIWLYASTAFFAACCLLAPPVTAA